MHLDGLDRDVELMGNGLVRVPPRHQPEDLALAISEVAQDISRLVILAPFFEVTECLAASDGALKAAEPFFREFVLRPLVASVLSPLWHRSC